MAWLSGHHQAPIFLTLASGGVWIYYILKDGRPNWAMARLAAVAMLFAPLVGALQILPAQEYGKLAWRWVGAHDHLGWNDAVPYYVHTQHAVRPIQLFGIIIPGFGAYEAPLWGVVALCLALVAIAVRWRVNYVKLFSAIALGGLVYSLGTNSIFQGFIYAVIPFVEKARVPAAALLLMYTGLSVLAAFGVDALQKQADSPGADSKWIQRINIGLAAFGLVAGILVLAVLLAKKNQWDMDDRVIITILVALLMAGLLYGWRSGNLTRRQSITLLTLLVLFELGNQASYVLADRNDVSRMSFLDKVRSNSDIADFLHKQPGPFRVEKATDDIPQNWGDFYGIDFVAAYAGVTTNTLLMDVYDPSNKQLVGIEYTLARKPTGPAQNLVFRGASGINVYQNPDVFPRAWAVHAIVLLAKNDEAGGFIHDRLNELRSTALSFENPAPKLPVCPGGKDTVTIDEYESARISISVNMGCDGMLVLSDTYYPGWVARVDGGRVPIHEVDVALRGVAVPKGEHKVTFRYRPRSVFWGAGLTLAGLVGAAILSLASGKGWPRVQPLSHHRPNLPIK